MNKIAKKKMHHPKISPLKSKSGSVFIGTGTEI